MWSTFRLEQGWRGVLHGVGGTDRSRGGAASSMASVFRCLSELQSCAVGIGASLELKYAVEALLVVSSYPPALPAQPRSSAVPPEVPFSSVV